LEGVHGQTELARANLENARVTAPFDGTVLRKDAEVGEIVAPSSAGGGLTRTAIVTMADLATLEVEVDVNEAYIAQIRAGQSAAITLDAYPDTSFRGAVRQVVPTADRQKATVQVKVSILDHDPRILPEMGAKVLFQNESHGEMRVAARGVLVPAAAVGEGPGGGGGAGAGGGGGAGAGRRERVGDRERARGRASGRARRHARRSGGGSQGTRRRRERRDRSAGGTQGGRAGSRQRQLNGRTRMA